jgi:cytochrome P450
LELQVASATLLRRLPNIRLAVADEEVRYQSGFVIRGVQGLPVAWERG